MAKQRTLICQRCLKKFEGIYRQKTCPPCSEKIMKDFNKPFNICMNCGITFKARLGAKYCSSACRQMAHRKNKQNLNVTTVTDEPGIISQPLTVTSVTNQLTLEEWQDIRNEITELRDVCYRYSQNRADYACNDEDLSEKEKQSIHSNTFKSCVRDSMDRVTKLHEYFKKLGMPEDKVLIPNLQVYDPAKSPTTATINFKPKPL